MPDAACPCLGRQVLRNWRGFEVTILSEDKTATQAAPGEEPKRRQEGGRDPLWYKDAIIYEVHVRAFFDSDGDGRGDFQGLTAKLDYLQDLGITAIWLLPFYPSPWRDDGYDISDYTSVHPAYGTLEDFQTFLDEAHKRGLQVVTELVINHTSDQHPWFQRARLAPSWSPSGTRRSCRLPPGRERSCSIPIS